MESIERLCREKNDWMARHPRAKIEKRLDEVRRKIDHLKITGWLKVEADSRRLKLNIDKEAWEEEAGLDGCYVIKSDLPGDVDKQTIHDRYKDLSKVEQAFRTCKTTMLNMRPWYVRKEESTRGHALVVMLAYYITRYLQQAWASLDLTVQEGLNHLSTLCSTKVIIKDHSSCHRIPLPGNTAAQLLEKANVRLPGALPNMEADVVSRKPLKSHRLSS